MVVPDLDETGLLVSEFVRCRAFQLFRSPSVVCSKLGQRRNVGDNRYPGGGIPSASRERPVNVLPPDGETLDSVADLA